jgi:ferredoxin
MAPAIFPVDDDGFTTLVHSVEVEESEIAEAAVAVTACPERVFTMPGA